jgi:predicted DNA-binding protein with PD1-like motif
MYAAYLNGGGTGLGVREFEVGRNFLVRVAHGSDIIDFLTDVAKEHGIVTATFTAVGALKDAKLAFYDQDRHVYLETLLSAPQEIASCVGNISVKEGKPFVHAHAVLADQAGVVRAGHLLEGKVFAAEVHLIELVGEKVVRKHDAVTGLSLWDI